MSFFNSTIGKKFLVAITGLVLIGFVVIHMLGNLQVFLGPEKINGYGALLKREPLILWGSRFFLLGCVLAHIVATAQLTRRNKQSRPIAYQDYEPRRASAASRTMIWGGLFLMSFIVFHLLHVTIGSVHPQFSHTDIYSNIVIGFSSWPISFFYIFGMMSLGMHLYHGVFSVFQTLGVQHAGLNCLRRPLALLIAISIPLGFISVPVSVLMGVLH